MKIQSTATRDELRLRLRRIEGQVRGIQKMLDDDRECREIGQQLSAVQAALRTATTGFMHTHAKECLVQSVDLEPAQRDALVDELFNLIATTK